MKSEIRFVMHPDDEKVFESHVLTDEDVVLIDGPRWKTNDPPIVRSFSSLTNECCIIWSRSDSPKLKARYIETCDDWYCESGGATFQIFRSGFFDTFLTEGRILIGTTPRDNPFSASCGAKVEARYKGLRRLIKKQFMASLVVWSKPKSEGCSQLDPSLWIGSAAINWLRKDADRRVKQHQNSRVEGRLVD